MLSGGKVSIQSKGSREQGKAQVAGAEARGVIGDEVREETGARSWAHKQSCRAF